MVDLSINNNHMAVDVSYTIYTVKFFFNIDSIWRHINQLIN